jgi:hypothetical protein
MTVVEVVSAASGVQIWLFSLAVLCYCSGSGDRQAHRRSPPPGAAGLRYPVRVVRTQALIFLEFGQPMRGASDCGGGFGEYEVLFPDFTAGAYELVKDFHGVKAWIGLGGA